MNLDKKTYKKFLKQVINTHNVSLVINNSEKKNNDKDNAKKEEKRIPKES